MTNTLSGIAEELERLDKLATPGPWEASEDAVGGDNDYKTLVQVPSRTGMFGTPVVYCHHDWEEDRISWKQAEANAALIALIRSNLPAFIEAAALIRTAEDRENVLREALEWLESYLRDTPHHNAPAAANARAVLGQALGGTNAKR